MQNHYRDYPPVHIAVAQFLGFETKPKPPREPARALQEGDAGYEAAKAKDIAELQQLAALFAGQG